MPKPKATFLQVKNSAGDNKAELLIYGDIGEWWDDVSSKEFAEQMKVVKGKDLDVYINSDGGSVFTASAILSQLKRHDAGVTVHIDGIAASAASFIAMAGDKIIMPANSMMFIHNPLTNSWGNAADMRKTADDLDRIREAIVSAYQEKTKLERDKIIEIMDADTWLTANEAVELGFADEVAPARHIAASLAGTDMTLNGVQFDLSRYKSVPSQILQSAGAPAKPEPKASKENVSMLTLEKLQAEHAELYQQVLDQGYQNGVTAERTRLQAIDELGVQAHGELVAKAKYGEPMNAGALAVAVLQADKQKGQVYRNSVKTDAEPMNNLAQEEPENQQDQENEKTVKAASAIAEGFAAALGKKRK